MEWYILQIRRTPLGELPIKQKIQDNILSSAGLNQKRIKKKKKTNLDWFSSKEQNEVEELFVVIVTVFAIKFQL